MILKNNYNLDSDIAFSGQEALEKVQERILLRKMNSYKLIFMDINMPGMDGVKCTELIRQILHQNN